jgi:hypothetical protein
MTAIGSATIVRYLCLRAAAVLSVSSAVGAGVVVGQDLPDAGTLIDQVFEAYGGTERLAAVTGYRIEGQLQATRRPAPVKMIRLFERPGRLRVELHYPDFPETRLLDGTRGWRERGEGAQPVSGMLLTAMMLQAARANLPWMLDAHRDIVRVVGPVPRGDRSLIGLELALGSTVLFRAYVDPVTHYIVESLGILLANGQRIMFETHYSDFRTVDGVVFPFAEENYASGTHTGSTQLTRVEVNPALNPDAFQPQP